MAADTRTRVRLGEERPTVVPPFDPREYARSHEVQSTRSGVQPAVDAKVSVSSDLAETDSGREMLELPENRFFAQLDERVRRAELLLALLWSKALSREIVGRALRAQLAAVRQGAIGLGAPQLVDLLEVLGAVVGELTDLHRASGDGETSPLAPLDLLVLDESEVSRDLVALAVESHGHTVRCAASFEEFVARFGERAPGLVIADAELADAPPRYLVRNLRDVLGGVPLALFTTQEGPDIERVARAADVVWWLPKSQGVEKLMTVLAHWLEHTRREEGRSG